MLLQLQEEPLPLTSPDTFTHMRIPTHSPKIWLFIIIEYTVFMKPLDFKIKVLCFFYEESDCKSQPMLLTKLLLNLGLKHLRHPYPLHEQVQGIESFCKRRYM